MIPERSRIFPPMKKTNSSAPLKSHLHPRNRHRKPYDFDLLVEKCPELKAQVFVNKYGNESIDFSDPKAVKMLNKALLRLHYGIDEWSIPDGYLCPPVPGRADYIHYAADLLASDSWKPPKGKNVRVMDLGVGANCIYPIIGHQEYGWYFVGTEIDKEAIDNANMIIEQNSMLERAMEIRHQADSMRVLKNMFQENEVFDLLICNPPFFANHEEARAGRKRKWKNLGKKGKTGDDQNFGGQTNELIYPRGERNFIRKLIEESAFFQHQCLWFTCLVSKEDHLNFCIERLKEQKVKDHVIVEMKQGQKKSRFLAWSYLLKDKRDKWARIRWK